MGIFKNCLCTQSLRYAQFFILGSRGKGNEVEPPISTTCTPMSVSPQNPPDNAPTPLPYCEKVDNRSPSRRVKYPV